MKERILIGWITLKSGKIIPYYEIIVIKKPRKVG